MFDQILLGFGGNAPFQAFLLRASEIQGRIDAPIAGTRDRDDAWKYLYLKKLGDAAVWLDVIQGDKGPPEVAHRRDLPDFALPARAGFLPPRLAEMRPNAGIERF